MNHDANTQTLLVLGKRAAGKTHYLVQLYGRLRDGESQLRLLSAPEDIRAVMEGLEKLADGQPADHTSSSVYHQITLTVETKDKKRGNLIFSDYAGEQIRGIVEDRQMSSDWVNRATTSAGWLLLVRVSAHHNIRYESLMDRPTDIEESQSIKSLNSYQPEWSTAAWFVELLQAFLYARNKIETLQTHIPPLIVALSCWDEIHDTKNKTPREVLSETMPLLLSFIESNWESHNVKFYGLAPLGIPLESASTEQKNKFRYDGPETQGFVILPNGNQSDDLTLPTIDLISMTK